LVARLPASALAQRADGSTSTSSALTSRVSGMARSAPSGPSSHAQKTRATNVVVVARPTESPT
jgi:hypothetical protein